MKNHLPKLLAIGILGVCLTTLPSHGAEAPANAIVGTADSSLSWFQKFLDNWEKFIEGREKQKIKNDLEIISSRLARMETTKRQLRNDLLKAVNGTSPSASEKHAIEGTLAKLSDDLKAYSDAIASLRGHLAITSSDDGPKLPSSQEALDQKRNIIVGLLTPSSRQVLTPGSGLVSFERRQRLTLEINRETDEALYLLGKAIEVVEKLQKKL